MSLNVTLFLDKHLNQQVNINSLTDVMKPEHVSDDAHAFFFCIQLLYHQAIVAQNHNHSVKIRQIPYS